MLTIKSPSQCDFDILALGEVMIRFDPGDSRIRNTRSFQVWEGGGEYNVARGLKRCFKQRAAVVTGIAKNEIGYLLEDLILQGGVDSSFIKWFESDGMGRDVRNGLNFTERGYGVRGALGCSDRGHSATSNIQPSDIDWETIFERRGVRWFHTGGVFSALSNASLDVTIEAMKAARRSGAIVSYDLNYRASLWEGRGGLTRCKEVNRLLAPFIDVVIGFPTFLSTESLSLEAMSLSQSDVEAQIRRVQSEFPNIKVFATTIRQTASANRTGWSAVCLADDQFYRSESIANLDVFDRVGGGDSFASGLIYGLMHLKDPQKAVEYGNAHGALAMTTPGDNSSASLHEVEALVQGYAGQTIR